MVPFHIRLSHVKILTLILILANDMGSNHEKKGLPQPPCGAFYGPGYVCREDSKFTTNPSYCVKKIVCPSEYARMCKEGTTESPYFLPRRFTIVMHGETAVLNKAF